MDEPVDVRYTDSPPRKLRGIWQLSRQVSARHGVSVFKQYAEVTALFLHRGIGPLTYYEHALWRPEFTPEEKRRWLTSLEFEQRVKGLNPPGFQCVSSHKVIEAALLRQACIPTPEYLGFLHPVDGLDVSGQPLGDIDALQALLQRLAPLRVCFKLVTGQQGQGFVATEVLWDGDAGVARSLVDGSTEPLAQFLMREVSPSIAQGYILQRVVEQHPRLREINPTSVNTVRIWVLQTESGPEVRGAGFRMGRMGQLTDNTARGGFFAPVALDSGCLGLAGTGSILPDTFSVHPDSGVQIEGFELPFWQECLALAQATLRALPQLRFTGLDLAIGKDGPIVIETNEFPNRISVRNFGLPMGDIIDPDFPFSPPA